MKLRKKMTAILLTAIFMISAFTLAVSADLNAVGGGTAEWSSDVYHSESRSAKLYVVNGGTDWAEISIPVDIALKDIAELKFWEYIESYLLNYGDPPLDYGWSVNIVLGIDADGDGDFEADVAEWHVGTNAHTLTALNGDSFVQMDGAQNDPTTGIWTETDALSISQWWTPDESGAGFATYESGATSFYGSFTNFVNVFLPDVTQTSLIPDDNAKVKCVKLLIGGSGSWMDETAYVDDVTINGVTYDLEPTTKADILRDRGVPGEGIDEAPGLDKIPPNDNFGGRNRQGPKTDEPEYGLGPQNESGPQSGPNKNANKNAYKHRNGV